MAARFFGQYLIEAGAISAAQLREALDLIESDYEKIGELAVKHGYLEKEDVNRLHREQRYIDSPLGQLAIERGLMTEVQLDKLLTEALICQNERTPLEASPRHHGQRRTLVQHDGRNR